MKMCLRIALAVGVLSSLAGGQVVQTQYGRALDANFNVQTGRVNSVRKADRAFDGNLYVTRQVAGGFGFRGDVGYFGANQIRLELPSAGQDQFIRSSAGLEPTGAIRAYRPEPYLSRTQTALTTFGITRRENIPGTDLPRHSFVPASAAKRLYDAAIEPIKPIRLDSGEKLRIIPLVAPDVPAEKRTLVKLPKELKLSDTAAFRPESSPLFGIIRPPDEPAEEAPRAGDLSATGRVKSQVEGMIPGLERPSGIPAEQAPQRQPAPAPALPPAGQDVYIDVLLRLREAQLAAFQPEPEPQPAPGEEPPPEQTPRQRALAEAGLPQVERRPGQVWIHSLAGKHDDLFNQRMRKAEHSLTQGRYYEAEGHYAIARVYNPQNPLAAMGRALAMFAAGEQLSAAYNAGLALRLMPKLSDTTVCVDVTRLLGQRVVGIRIDELERRLTQQEDQADPSLVFLAAFIRSCMDQHTKAMEHARFLKTLEGAEPIHRIYADHLLRKEELPAKAQGEGAP